MTTNNNSEAVFMENLLAGLESSFLEAMPSLDRTLDNVYKTPPKKHTRQPAFPSGHHSLRKRVKCEEKDDQILGAVKEEQEDLSQLLEGAESWDWDDMLDDFLTPNKHKSPRRLSSPRNPKLEAPPSLLGYHAEPHARCIVKQVNQTNTLDLYQKELIVAVVPSEDLRRIILCDDWVDGDIRPGDIINAIGTFTYPPSTSISCLPTLNVTSDANLIITHPDTLITATALSIAPTCLRRPLLQSLVHSSSDVTPALVYGSILHEIVQSSLKARRWDLGWLEAKVRDIVGRSLGELMRLDVGIVEATKEVLQRADGVQGFMNRYISSVPKEEAVLTGTGKGAVDERLAITGVLDIEEDIWSPTYGLKGKLDASVSTTVAPSYTPSLSKSAISQTKSGSVFGKMPLEIKTGRSNTILEHRAQTLLYTLLMSERYQTPIEAGLLWYTQGEGVLKVGTRRREIKGLMLIRNELAGWVARRAGSVGEKSQPVKDVEETFLPPTIDDGWLCGKCYVLDTCMLYRRAVENVKDTTSPIADIYTLKTSHLTPFQSAFFKKWEALITMEEHDLQRFKKELWTMQAEEREKHGRCYAGMCLDEGWVLEERVKASARKEGKIHQFTYRFTKSLALMSTPSGSLGGVAEGRQSLLSGHMSTGDAVTISVEPDILALARGFITELTPEHVILGVDHEISLSAIQELRPRLERNRIVFRIDKDELSGGMARVRDNLARLFYAEGDTRRLRLVVDLERPRFTPYSPLDIFLSSQEEDHTIVDIIAELNDNQRTAIHKVLSAEDYTLVLGMPGTGKTTVVAALIKVLIALGKSVLLTSYTHSAVDSILMKLKDGAAFGILRLGNLDKVHPEIHPFTLSAERAATSVEMLEHQLMTPPVVATTSLSIDHPLFSRRTFDYCIVDEASQITLPTCLGPLRFADKFVLVGDHFQLPPLVRNRAARKAGLDFSLFRMLSEAHPHAVIDLTEQYRMNEDIMLLSNKLIYGDRLKCGNEKVRKRGLILPDAGRLEKKLHVSGNEDCAQQGCWIKMLLEASRKVVFVDTDLVPARESHIGDLVQNTTEAHLVRQLACALLSSGISEDQIGIISLYRQQIKLLSYFLQTKPNIEILTADRSQGRDKDCVIISMVRSNEEGQIGDLLKDWRRINVSFTRARSKLVIIGSRSTLQSTPLLQDFFQLVQSKGWIVTLPPNAGGLHSQLGKLNLKRPAEDDEMRDDEELMTNQRVKKARKGAIVGEKLLRSRPLLKDVLNDSQ